METAKLPHSLYFANSVHMPRPTMHIWCVSKKQLRL